MLNLCKLPYWATEIVMFNSSTCFTIPRLICTNVSSMTKDIVTSDRGVDGTILLVSLVPCRLQIEYTREPFFPWLESADGFASASTKFQTS